MNRQEKLIAEIHAEFDTAQDRLLSQANQILSKPVDATQSAVESIGERLAKVGFTNTPTVKKANEIKERKGAEIKKVVETRELIQYYQTNYPFLKFLTEAELDRICKKYSLIHNHVGNYIGEIPFKNLEDIENAMPVKSTDRASDITYSLIDYHSHLIFGVFLSVWDSAFWKLPRRIENVSFTRLDPADEYLRENYDAPKSIYLVSSVKCFKEDRQGLFICAPKSQFKGIPLNISYTEIKDPIVFRYVRGGIQVLTKMGP